MDQFLKDFGYTYDYVFVCKVYDEAETNFNPVRFSELFCLQLLPFLLHFIVTIKIYDGEYH